MKQIEKTIAKIKNKKEREKAQLIYKWYTWQLSATHMRRLLTLILAKPGLAAGLSNSILYRIEEKKRENENNRSTKPA